MPANIADSGPFWSIPARVWLWLLLAVGGGMSALYVHLHPYFRQRAAVRAIRAAGGDFYFEDEKWDRRAFYTEKTVDHP
jgi:hypothetical protein